MRKYTTDIDEIKNNIKKLKGVAVGVAVNKGRKRTEHFDGEITDIFPSVFALTSDSGERMSFSYSDVICGNVVILAKA